MDNSNNSNNLNNQALQQIQKNQPQINQNQQFQQFQQFQQLQNQHQEQLQVIQQQAVQSVAVDVFFSIARLEGMRALAEYVIQSDLHPKIDMKGTRMSVQQLVIIFQYGSELGLSPMVAMKSIDVIFNSPALKPQAMIALARKTGELTNFFYESYDDCAKVFIQRRGQHLQEVCFTIEEADGMNLLGRDNWKKQPRNMLIWRAVARGMRLFFPDAIGGLYTADELGSEDVIDLLPDQGTPEDNPKNKVITNNNNTNNQIGSKGSLQLLESNNVPNNQKQPNPPLQETTYVSERDSIVDRILKLKYKVLKMGHEVENKNLENLDLEALKEYGNSLRILAGKPLAKDLDVNNVNSINQEVTNVESQSETQNVISMPGSSVTTVKLTTVKQNLTIVKDENIIDAEVISDSDTNNT